MKGGSEGKEDKRKEGRGAGRKERSLLAVSWTMPRVTFWILVKIR